MSLTYKMSILLLFVSLFWGSSWTVSQAQTSLSAGETQPTVRLIAHMGGQPAGFYPTGQFVYATIGPDFTMIDVSTPLTPTRLGYVTIGGFLSDITVVDHYAWVAGGRAGVHIVDTTRWPSITGMVPNGSQSFRAKSI